MLSLVNYAALDKSLSVAKFVSFSFFFFRQVRALDEVVSWVLLALKFYNFLFTNISFIKEIDLE